MIWEIAVATNNKKKEELVGCICKINKSAKPKFLAKFSEKELQKYFDHLMELDLKDLVICS